MSDPNLNTVDGLRICDPCLDGEGDMCLLDIFVEEPQVMGFRELSWRGTTIVVDRTCTALGVFEDGEQVASLAVIDGRLEPAYDDEPLDAELMARVRAVLARSITPELRALAGEEVAS